MTLGQKIRYLRETASMSQGELARRLNISNGTMSKYETDALEANVTIIREVSRIFNVSADFLIHEGNSTPVCPPELTEDEVDLINLYRTTGGGIVDEREYQIVRMYRELSPEEKGEVRGLMRGLALKKQDDAVKKVVP